MSNRFLKTFCAAWVGAGLVACGSVQQEKEPATGEAKDADIQAALARLPGAEVLGREGEVPYFIRGDLGRLSSVSAQRARADAPGSEARESLGDIAAAFRLRNDDLVFRRASKDSEGHQHLRFRQLLHGRPVVGAELVIHAD
ncbi:peptidase M4, partial [Pyxidicoccus sp. 3LG]